MVRAGNDVIQPTNVPFTYESSGALLPPGDMGSYLRATSCVTVNVAERTEEKVSPVTVAASESYLRPLLMATHLRVIPWHNTQQVPL